MLISCHPPFDCRPDVDPTILNLNRWLLRNQPELEPFTGEFSSPSQIGAVIARSDGSGEV
jgi:hypothetical protein